VCSKESSRRRGSRSTSSRIVSFNMAAEAARNRPGSGAYSAL
jgi:hypothetical protein